MEFVLKAIIVSFICCVTSLTAKVKIACVGDSITYGAGMMHREKLNYPMQLGYMLGDDFEVKNFGVSGATLLNKGDKPYTKQKAYKESLAYQPNLVIIKLGTNDSKPRNWKLQQEFIQDAKSLIESYQKLPSKPRVIICKPIVVSRSGWGITETVTRHQVAPKIEEVAYQTGVEIVDLHPLLLKNNYMLDGVHPNVFDAEIMADHLHRYLTTKQQKGMAKTPPMIPGKNFSFHGYWGVDFKHDGVSMKLVRPKIVADGKPWIWRARHWGEQPQFDIAMLELGWHVVYADVKDLYGSPKAIDKWEKAYAYTQQFGLNPKPVLEGMGKGGLPIHNWALKHPNKTGGIIADNALMDFMAWPYMRGVGKPSEATWKKIKTAYDFKSEKEARKYKDHPINQVEKLKENNIPVLYIISEEDKLVAPFQNGDLAATKLKGYKNLHVIKKPGAGHFPYSLPDPAPIVDFALKCNGSYISPSTISKPSIEFRKGCGWGNDIWFDQHEKINKLAAENKDLELVFLGDSITQSWTGIYERISKPKGKRPFDRYFGTKWKSASFGLSGDRTEHLIYRIDKGNFDHITPKVVVLMIGVNNVLSKNHNAEQIADGIKAVTESLHKKLPKSKILLLGPIPTGATVEDKNRQTLEKVHAVIEKLDGKNNVTYLNLKSTFVGEDEKLRPNIYRGDNIHLQATGYEAWAKVLLPKLEVMMNK